MDRDILGKNGFSLVELAIVMGIVALLTTAVLPVMVRAVEIRAGEKTIAEVGVIQAAGRKYHRDHHEWPTDLKQMQIDGYLSPLWSLLNPWGHPYQVMFDEKKMSVSVQVPLNLVPMINSRLLQASFAGDVVSSVTGANDQDEIASGVIVAWSGSIASIPLGWVLCDGQNGTPDLRDKFIVGSRQDEGGVSKTNLQGKLEKSGGSISHDHGSETGPHALTIAEMPAHHHAYNETPWLGSRYDGHSSPVMTGQISSLTSDTGGNQAHTHPIVPAIHAPPFYALAFIMKL